MNVVYVYADSPSEWNCSEWRCAVPARAINRTGRHHAELIHIEDFAYHNPAADQLCAGANIIVVQRNLFGPVLAAIQYWKARDKVLIADFDDAYDLMPENVVNYDFWHAGAGRDKSGREVKIDPPPLVQFKWGLRMVHGATVASRRLVEDWASFTDVYYLPNYIDPAPYSGFTSKNGAGLTIGWGGSLSHLQSFQGSGVVKALQRVCAARPQVKVMIAGADARIEKLLPLPKRQIIRQPWVPYARWGETLAQYDIGLAPLFGAYDERRSWIKVLEYMVMKIPWIASDGPPYQELRSFGWLVQNTPQAWERVLLDLVDHLDEYKHEAASEPYLFGISKSVDENVDHILAVYGEIAARVQDQRQQTGSAAQALSFI